MDVQKVVVTKNTPYHWQMKRGLARRLHGAKQNLSPLHLPLVMESLTLRTGSMAPTLHLSLLWGCQSLIWHRLEVNKYLVLRSDGHSYSFMNCICLPIFIYGLKLRLKCEVKISIL